MGLRNASPFVSLALLLGAQVGCSSPKKKAYERVARDANALFSELKPTAAKLLALRPDEHAAIIDACHSTDEVLWSLRHVKFDYSAIYAPPYPQTAAHHAVTLLDDRKLMCRDPEGAPHRTAWCSRWCLETWTGLIETVEKLRASAKKEGVDIVSLRP